PVLFPETDQRFDIICQPLLFLRLFPVYPGSIIVLTIHIIVSILRICELVSGQNTRRPLSHQKQEKCIAHLLLSEFYNRFFSCRTFYSAVPAVIVVRSIMIILAI